MAELLNSEQMAACIDCSPQRLRELTRRGVIPKAGHGRYERDAATVAYIRHLREQAAGRAGEGEGLNLSDERARLARAQRVKTELDIAATRRALVPAAEVRSEAAKLASIIIAALDALPARLSDELAGMIDPFQIDQKIREETAHMIEEVRRLHWIPEPKPPETTP